MEIRNDLVPGGPESEDEERAGPPPGNPWALNLDLSPEDFNIRMELPTAGTGVKHTEGLARWDPAQMGTNMWSQIFGTIGRMLGVDIGGKEVIRETDPDNPLTLVLDPTSPDVGIDDDVLASISEQSPGTAASLNRLRDWRRMLSAAGTESVFVPAFQNLVMGQDVPWTREGRYERGTLAPPTTLEEKWIDNLFAPLVGGLIPGLTAYHAVRWPLAAALKSSIGRRAMAGHLFSSQKAMMASLATKGNYAQTITRMNRRIQLTSEWVADAASGAGYGAAYGAAAQMETEGKIDPQNVWQYAALGGAAGAALGGLFQVPRLLHQPRNLRRGLESGRIKLEADLKYLQDNLPNGYRPRDPEGHGWERLNIEWYKKEPEVVDGVLKRGGEGRFYHLTDEGKKKGWAKSPWPKDFSAMTPQSALDLGDAVMEAQIHRLNTELKNRGIIDKDFRKIVRGGKLNEVFEKLEEQGVRPEDILASPGAAKELVQEIVPVEGINETAFRHVIGREADQGMLNRAIQDVSAQMDQDLRGIPISRPGYPDHQHVSQKMKNWTLEEMVDQINARDVVWTDPSIDQNLRLQAMAESNVIKSLAGQDLGLNAAELQKRGVRQPHPTVPLLEARVESLASKLANWHDVDPHKFEEAIHIEKNAAKNHPDEHTRVQARKVVEATYRKVQDRALADVSWPTQLATKMSHISTLDYDRGLWRGATVLIKDADGNFKDAIITGYPMYGHASIQVAGEAIPRPHFNLKEVYIKPTVQDWVLVRYQGEILPGQVRPFNPSGTSTGYRVIVADPSGGGAGRLKEITAQPEDFVFISPQGGDLDDIALRRAKISNEYIQKRFRENLGELPPDGLVWDKDYLQKVPAADRQFQMRGSQWEAIERSVDQEWYKLRHMDTGITMVLSKARVKNNIQGILNSDMAHLGQSAQRVSETVVPVEGALKPKEKPPISPDGVVNTGEVGPKQVRVDPVTRAATPLKEQIPTPAGATRVKKIISGGQTGADVAGLRAAKELGLESGGTAPYNFATETGPNRSLAGDFGLVEGPNTGSVRGDYVARTKQNVLDSDGTILFGNPNSSGSKATIREALEAKKPLLQIRDPDAADVAEVRKWLAENNVEVLNIAGNRESVTKGIETRTSAFLRKVLGAPTEAGAPTPVKPRVTNSKPLAMYYTYGRAPALDAAKELQERGVRTTFEAIEAGLRTATSSPPGSTRFNGYKVGDIVNVRDRSGRQLQLEITGFNKTADIGPEEWARREGYDLAQVKENWTEGKNYSSWDQMTYKLASGTKPTPTRYSGVINSGQKPVEGHHIQYVVVPKKYAAQAMEAWKTGKMNTLFGILAGNKKEVFHTYMIPPTMDRLGERVVMALEIPGPVSQKAGQLVGATETKTFFRTRVLPKNRQVLIKPAISYTQEQLGQMRGLYTAHDDILPVMHLFPRAGEGGAEWTREMTDYYLRMIEHRGVLIPEQVETIKAERALHANAERARVADPVVRNQNLDSKSAVVAELNHYLRQGLEDYPTSLGFIENALAQNKEWMGNTLVRIIKQDLSDPRTAGAMQIREALERIQHRPKQLGEFLNRYREIAKQIDLETQHRQSMTAPEAQEVLDQAFERHRPEIVQAMDAILTEHGIVDPLENPVPMRFTHPTTPNQQLEVTVVPVVAQTPEARRGTVRRMLGRNYDKVARGEAIANLTNEGIVQLPSAGEYLSGKRSISARTSRMRKFHEAIKAAQKEGKIPEGMEEGWFEVNSPLPEHGGRPQPLYVRYLGEEYKTKELVERAGFATEPPTRREQKSWTQGHRKLHLYEFLRPSDIIPDESELKSLFRPKLAERGRFGRPDVADQAFPRPIEMKPTPNIMVREILPNGRAGELINLASPATFPPEVTSQFVVRSQLPRMMIESRMAAIEGIESPLEIYIQKALQGQPLEISGKEYPRWASPKGGKHLPYWISSKAHENKILKIWTRDREIQAAGMPDSQLMDWTIDPNDARLAADEPLTQHEIAQAAAEARDYLESLDLDFDNNNYVYNVETGQAERRVPPGTPAFAREIVPTRRKGSRVSTDFDEGFGAAEGYVPGEERKVRPKNYTRIVNTGYARTLNLEDRQAGLLGYEVSSAAHPRSKARPGPGITKTETGAQFSPFEARLKEGPYKGRSIEDIYQMEIKGYKEKYPKWPRNRQEMQSLYGEWPGKGKPPLTNLSPTEEYLRYKALWAQFLDENPELAARLAEESKGKVLTDAFMSKNQVSNQAKALDELLVERGLREPVGEMPWYRMGREDSSIDIAGQKGARRAEPDPFRWVSEEDIPGGPFARQPADLEIWKNLDDLAKSDLEMKRQMVLMDRFGLEDPEFISIAQGIAEARGLSEPTEEIIEGLREMRYNHLLAEAGKRVDENKRIVNEDVNGRKMMRSETFKRIMRSMDEPYYGAYTVPHPAKSYEEQLLLLGKILHQYDLGQATFPGVGEFVHPLHPDAYGIIRKMYQGQYRVVLSQVPDARGSSPSWHGDIIENGNVEFATREQAEQFLADAGFVRNGNDMLHGDFEHIRDLPQLMKPARDEGGAILRDPITHQPIMEPALSPDQVIQMNKELGTAIDTYHRKLGYVPQHIVDFANEFVDGPWNGYWDPREPAVLLGDLNQERVGIKLSDIREAGEPEAHLGTSIGKGPGGSVFELGGPSYGGPNDWSRNSRNVLSKWGDRPDKLTWDGERLIQKYTDTEEWERVMGMPGLRTIQSLPEAERVANWVRLGKDQIWQDNTLQFAYMDLLPGNQSHINSSGGLRNPEFDAFGDLDWLAQPRILYRDGGRIRAALVHRAMSEPGQETMVIKRWKRIDPQNGMPEWEEVVIPKEDVTSWINPYSYRVGDPESPSIVPINRTRSLGESVVDEKFGLLGITDPKEFGAGLMEAGRKIMVHGPEGSKSSPWVIKDSKGNLIVSPAKATSDQVTDLADWYLRMAEARRGDRSVSQFVDYMKKELGLKSGLGGTKGFDTWLQQQARARSIQLSGGDPHGPAGLPHLIADSKVGLLPEATDKRFRKKFQESFLETPEELYTRKHGSPAEKAKVSKIIDQRRAEAAKLPTWELIERMADHGLDTELMSDMFEHVIKPGFLNQIADQHGIIQRGGFIRFFKDPKNLRAGDLALPSTIADRHPTFRWMYGMADQARREQNNSHARWRNLLGAYLKAYDPDNAAADQVLKIWEKWGGWLNFEAMGGKEYTEWANKRLAWKGHEGADRTLSFKEFYDELSRPMEWARLENIRRRVEVRDYVYEITPENLDTPETKRIMDDFLGYLREDIIREEVAKSGRVRVIAERRDGAGMVMMRPEHEVNFFVDRIAKLRPGEEIDAETLAQIRSHVVEDPNDPTREINPWEWMLDEADDWRAYGLEDDWAPTIHEGQLEVRKHMPNGPAGGEVVAYVKTERQFRKWLRELERNKDPLVEEVKAVGDPDKAYFNVTAKGMRIDSQDFSLAEPATIHDAMKYFQTSGEQIQGSEIPLYRGRESRGVRMMSPTGGHLRSPVTDTYERIHIYLSRTTNNRFNNQVLRVVEAARLMDNDLSRAYGTKHLFPEIPEGTPLINRGDVSPRSGVPSIYRATEKWVRAILGDRTRHERNIDEWLKWFTFVEEYPGKVARNIERAIKQSGETDPVLNWRDIFRDEIGSPRDPLYYRPYKGKELFSQITHLQGIMRLGFSPAAAGVNSVQWMVNTIPETGPVHAKNAFLHDMKILRAGRKEAEELMSKWGPDWFDRVRAGTVETKLSPEFIELKRFLDDVGAELYVPRSSIEEPLGQALGRNLLRKDPLRSPRTGPVESALQTAEDWSLWMFNRAEGVNRVVTALAARRQGMLDLNIQDYRELVMHGRGLINKTQFDYSEFGLPAVMRASHLRALMQFKPFLANQLKYEKELVRKIVAAGPGQRGEAMKALGYHMAAIGAFGGLSGIAYSPWVYAGLAAANWLGVLDTNTSAGSYDTGHEGAVANWMYRFPLGGGRERNQGGVTRLDSPWFNAKNVLLFGLPGIFGADVSRRMNVSGPEIMASSLHDMGNLIFGPHMSMYANFINAMVLNDDMEAELGTLGRYGSVAAAALASGTLRGWGGLLAGVGTALGASIPRAAKGKGDLLIEPGAVLTGLHQWAAGLDPTGAIQPPRRRDVTPGSLFNTRKGRRFVNQTIPTLLRNVDASMEILNYGYLLDLGLNRDELGDPAYNNYVNIPFYGPRTIAELNEAVLKAMGVTSINRRMDQAAITVWRDQQTDLEGKSGHWAQKIAEAKVFGGDWVSVWAQASRQGVIITQDMLDPRIEALTRDLMEREIDRLSPKLRIPAHRKGRH